MVEQRISCTREYLAALESSMQIDWLEQYEAYLEGHVSLPYAFALIHPCHYEDLNPLRASGIRGSRNFPQEVGMSSIRCASELIWGYQCSRNLGETVQADHLFPYSLGGQTVASNKIYLCSMHNQMKSNDLHLYPWEKGAPGWLSSCLRAIAKIREL